MNNKRVLVVDDSDCVRSLLEDILSVEGYEVKTAENGEEACAHFDRYGFPIVVTDLEMPRGNGLRVLEHVKRRSPHTIVVLLSATHDFTSVVRAVNSGCDAFLCKPLSSINTLHSTIQACRQRLACIRDEGVRPVH